MAKPLKRSVSPFGLLEPEAGPFDELNQTLTSAFPSSESSASNKLASLNDAPALPLVLQEILEAPSNDCPELSSVCEYVVRFRSEWEEKGLKDLIYGAVQKIFDQKTAIFLIDHHDEEHCKKMGWADSYRDVVLFSKERDILVGRYFAPMSEHNPGLFSEFISRWTQSDRPESLLHFLDFCLGSKNPTFEHYLLFTHPALARVLRNKSSLKDMLEKAAPILKKITSPTWEKDVRKAFEI